MQPTKLYKFAAAAVMSTIAVATVVTFTSSDLAGSSPVSALPRVPGANAAAPSVGVSETPEPSTTPPPPPTSEASPSASPSPTTSSRSTDRATSAPTKPKPKPTSPSPSPSPTREGGLGGLVGGLLGN